MPGSVEWLVVLLVLILGGVAWIAWRQAKNRGLALKQMGSWLLTAIVLITGLPWVIVTTLIATLGWGPVAGAGVGAVMLCILAGALWVTSGPLREGPE